MRKILELQNFLWLSIVTTDFNFYKLLWLLVFMNFRVIYFSLMYFHRKEENFLSPYVFNTVFSKIYELS